MALPSDEDIRRFLTRAVHEAEDLAQLSRTTLKDQLKQYFKLNSAAGKRLDEDEHYKLAIRTYIKDAIATRDERRAGPSSKSPEPADDDEGDDSKDVETEYSSLEDDEPAKKRKGKGRASSAEATKKPRTSAISTKSSTGKGRKSSSASTTSDEATLKKLKGYVLMCGTRKPWKNLFAEHGCGKEDAELGDDEVAKRKECKRQIEVVKGVLAEIGMTTPYSKIKAQKIKEDREFKQELEAIQQAGTTERSATRSRRSGRAAASSADSDAESGDEGPRASKPKAFNNSLAAFAAELNDSD